jgi:hypothetical protein
MKRIKNISERTTPGKYRMRNSRRGCCLDSNTQVNKAKFNPTDRNNATDFKHRLHCFYSLEKIYVY